jgi:3-oxoacyl-[acyl-carrier-protein] synthase II
MIKEKKIAITGLGVFCAAGKNVSSFTVSLLGGKCAIGPIDLFDVAPFQGKIGAQVKDYDPLDYFDRRSAGRLSRADQFGVAAAGEALADSGVREVYSPYDIGVCVGAGAAGMLQGEHWFRETLSGGAGRPSLLRGILPDRTSTAISEMFNLAGYQGTVTTACSSSATAIGWGADLVATGRLKAVICGGADALSILTFAGFNSLRVVDFEPCAPFSLERRGISLGEGAAFFILEDEAAARQRGAKIYGHVLGYAVAGEAYHMTGPEPTGVESARVMADAVVKSGVSLSDVGWVNAHGTGTLQNDVVETKAMKLLFGERARKVPLVSTKALTGHCLGAAGAIEALATVVALGAGTIPRTLNFRGFDPECDLEYCHGGSMRTSSTVALSNSFAFGGNTTTLVLGI